jgi:hypothetical protein
MPLVLAWLWLLAHVAGAAHLVLERHERCPEHGALVHVAIDEEPTVPRAPADEDADGASLRASTRRRGVHGEDEHCPIIASGQARVAKTSSSACTAVLPPFSPARDLSAGETERALPFPLFRLAPNHSPPASVA